MSKYRIELLPGHIDCHFEPEEREIDGLIFRSERPRFMVEKRQSVEDKQAKRAALLLKLQEYFPANVAAALTTVLDHVESDTGVDA